ncbi:hypothetical protein RHODGE_RHODGE_03077 [Rhodoplanes serenus]|uniref:Flagellar protein FlgJ N-terminal domain-containing protein n=1 Tax=Rhodoplanes serenus TaxID=200615 RepID=A0A447CX41_9BRAD|nr:rod-binding protein [Rhodoplanes serenus]VCU09910.1 hypothetical protein RHODGE_RHODGE_03077 [Rhodoplanes serenus]
MTAALPGLSPAATVALDAGRRGAPAAGTAGAVAIGSRAMPAKSAAETARAQAQDFEAMFLNTMMQSMFTETGGDGPLGNSPGTGVWRSFLVDEYAKSFAKAGGVGLADQVYATLLGQQEARSATATRNLVSTR